MLLYDNVNCTDCVRFDVYLCILLLFVLSFSSVCCVYLLHLMRNKLYINAKMKQVYVSLNQAPEMFVCTPCVVEELIKLFGTFIFY